MQLRDNAELAGKMRALEELLRSWGSVAIGFSGGVDSTFLAAVCARVLPEATLLVRLETPFTTTPERAAAEGALGSAGNGTVPERPEPAALASLPVLGIPYDALGIPQIARNSADRCYWCKRFGFEQIVEAARARGIAVVADGSNADDALEDRPGIRALRELGVRSPLMETGWRKEEERALLRAWGFAQWDMPAEACLATRVRRGEPITAEKLGIVRACEDLLRQHGFRSVRARLGAGEMRLEFKEDELACKRDQLTSELRAELERLAGCPVAW